MDDFLLRPLQLNFLFLGPDRPIKFVNEMFLFIFKDHVFHHQSLWCRCIVGHPYLMHGVSLVIARELYKQIMDGRLVI